MMAMNNDETLRGLPGTPFSNVISRTPSFRNHGPSGVNSLPMQTYTPTTTTTTTALGGATQIR